MIKDDKAEKLESMGLYRRAAVRWTDIMLRAK
ncbi:TPA: PerC family transcriptional regulator, partial [Escherichia coli]